MEDLPVERVNVTDRDGCKLPQWKIGDLYLPIDFLEPEKRLKKIVNFESKKGDVMVCSFPKAGTHWVSEMVKMLQANSAEMKIARNVWFGFEPDFEDVVNQPPPRHFICHFVPDMLPQQILQKEKVILLQRNPKDSAVSLYYYMVRQQKIHGYNGTCGAFVDLYMGCKAMYSSYFDYYRKWDEAIKAHPEYKVLVLRYEDMLRNDQLEILKKICNFLEIERTEELLLAVLDRCKLPSLKKDIETHPMMKERLSRTTEDGTHPAYRKGVIGDWKNHFTVAQNEAFDKWIQENSTDTIFNNHIWE